VPRRTSCAGVELSFGAAAASCSGGVGLAVSDSGGENDSCGEETSRQENM
jgi:hypothetical protein